jgi:hypothetical protein
VIFQIKTVLQMLDWVDYRPLPAQHAVNNAGTALLLILLLGDPEIISRGHDVSQSRCTQEHHVLTTRRVLDVQLEFLQDSMERKDEGMQE